MPWVALDEVRDLSQGLPPLDQPRLIDELVHQLLQAQPTPENPPSRAPWGALAHLGPAPSAGDIDQMRRDAWARFPREDGSE